MRQNKRGPHEMVRKEQICMGECYDDGWLDLDVFRDQRAYST